MEGKVVLVSLLSNYYGTMQTIKSVKSRSFISIFFTCLLPKLSMIYLIYAWTNELEKREFAIRRFGSINSSAPGTTRTSAIEHAQVL